MGYKIYRKDGRFLLELKCDTLVDKNLKYIDLGDADLTDCDFTNTDLQYANLSGCKVSISQLSKIKGVAGVEEIPVVEDLHCQILAAIESKQWQLDMDYWHGGNACGTTHCYAGSAIDLAGIDGYVLQDKLGANVAGALIILNSCSWLSEVPDFFASNEEALTAIKANAQIELQRKTTNQ